MMKFKWSAVLTFLLVFTLMTGGSALAFSDINDTVGKEDIMALKDKGIISGISDTIFAPNGKLSYAQGITLITKGLNLNINAMSFFKEPKASDFFTKVSDKAWYAQSLMFAQLNGLTLPKDLDPNKLMTREEFTNYLIEGINTTGDYPMIMMYAVINDEKDVNTLYMNSIQQALITKIASADKDQNFYPKRAITRAEAAVMLAKAIEFVETNKNNVIPPAPVNEFPNAEVSYTATPVTSAVYQVDLTWKQAPSPGHSIKIERIEFQGKQALIFYSLQKPVEGSMSAQVLTDLKASTYVDSTYEVQLVRSEDAVVTGGFDPMDPTQSTGIINPETGTSQSSEGSAGQ
ncbi:S-layer homology domain-containing protein [Paenibacillus psychroresistens]|uniref:S-layer homology domain-containing protein n=1 Tax=Paenibacillus psychroresistens TaxID=1778678 RepID=A0A6B8RHK9_9BACL|nr:S-layer homology domain-containing protein [Paenibacillus psychroresistens]QGQ94856.1 S-layer homology domain-containing protein [Paenibacillus psychroresistens]